MKAEHIWVIPDQGSLKGGFLYDRYGNLDYFADTSALTDKTQNPTDLDVAVKAFTRESFMRDPAPKNVSAFTRYVTVGTGQSKGGFPGSVVTFNSIENGEVKESRQFSYTGAISGLVAWLKTTNKLAIDVYSERGRLNASIPAQAPAG